MRADAPTRLRSHDPPTSRAKAGDLLARHAEGVKIARGDTEVFRDRFHGLCSALVGVELILVQKRSLAPRVTNVRRLEVPRGRAHSASPSASLPASRTAGASWETSTVASGYRRVGSPPQPRRKRRGRKRMDGDATQKTRAASTAMPVVDVSPWCGGLVIAATQSNAHRSETSRERVGGVAASGSAPWRKASIAARFRARIDADDCALSAPFWIWHRYCRYHVGMRLMVRLLTRRR